MKEYVSFLIPPLTVTSSCWSHLPNYFLGAFPSLTLIFVWKHWFHRPIRFSHFGQEWLHELLIKHGHFSPTILSFPTHTLETRSEKRTTTSSRFTDDSSPFEGTKSGVPSAVSLQPLCLSEERTKGSASSPSPSSARRRRQAWQKNRAGGQGDHAGAGASSPPHAHVTRATHLG